MLCFEAPNHWKDVVRLVFSRDGSALIGGCFGYGVAAWEVASGAVLSQHTRRLSGCIFGLMLAPDGSFVCFPAAWDGLVHLAYPGLELLSPQIGSGYTRFAALAPDGARVLRSRYISVGTTTAPFGVAVVSNPPDWDHAEWERFEAGWIPVGGAFLTGGERVVVAERSHSADGGSRLVVNDTATGTVLRTVVCQPKEVTDMLTSGDGRRLVLTAGRSLWVWDAINWDTPPKKVPNDTRFHFTGIAFHPSGKYLAATSNDATVKLYDTTTWEVARTFTWKIGEMRSVAFSPDGNLAAAGSVSGKVVVWDVDL